MTAESCNIAGALRRIEACALAHGRGVDAFHQRLGHQRLAYQRPGSPWAWRPTVGAAPYCVDPGIDGHPDGRVPGDGRATRTGLYRHGDWPAELLFRPAVVGRRDG